MNPLTNQVFGSNETSEVKDVFAQQSSVDEEILREYHFRNERKKQDEKWLKENKGVILKGLEELGKRKADWGGFRASYSTPDKSHFDMEKVMLYLIAHKLTDQATKLVVDEDKLAKLIEDEIIDLEDLKNFAWVEKYDAPRLTVSVVKG